MYKNPVTFSSSVVVVFIDRNFGVKEYPLQETASCSLTSSVQNLITLLFLTLTLFNKKWASISGYLYVNKSGFVGILLSYYLCKYNSPFFDIFILYLRVKIKSLALCA